MVKTYGFVWCECVNNVLSKGIFKSNVFELVKEIVKSDLESFKKELKGSAKGWVHEMVWTFSLKIFYSWFIFRQKLSILWFFFPLWFHAFRSRILKLANAAATVLPRNKIRRGSLWCFFVIYNSQWTCSVLFLIFSNISTRLLNFILHWTLVE